MAAYNGKKDSLHNMILTLKPAVLLLQETKLYRKGTIKINNYCSFESLSPHGECGGLLTLIHENLNPVLIPVESDLKMTENFLVTEADLSKQRICYINCYGVQETALCDDKVDFIYILDKEVQNALNSGRFECIAMDGNGKLGHSILPSTYKSIKLSLHFSL